MTDYLQHAIDRARSKDSIYWAFRSAVPSDWNAEHEVEIRLNLSSAPGSLDWEGWSLAKIDHELGAVFLRRRQPLTDDDLRRLFEDALTLSVRKDGQFHSWVHGARLDLLSSGAAA
ncbi:MAG: hypothetical protein Q8L66_14320 [Caulobacter sp.]|nr:hypothetical protein [Caulobacter sp.]